MSVGSKQKKNQIHSSKFFLPAVWVLWYDKSCIYLAWFIFDKSDVAVTNTLISYLCLQIDFLMNWYKASLNPSDVITLLPLQMWVDSATGCKVKHSLTGLVVLSIHSQNHQQVTINLLFWVLLAHKLFLEPSGLFSWFADVMQNITMQGTFVKYAFDIFGSNIYRQI